MKDDLVVNNLSLIYFVINRLNLREKTDYYYGIGLMGLIKAAMVYDPNRGVKFTTLAITCIKNKILTDIRSNKKKIDNIAYSMDEPALPDEDITLSEIVADDFDLEEHIIRKEEIKVLREAIKKLEPEERALIDLYFSLDKHVTQTDIAKSLNTTQTSVCRKIKKILKKLRKLMKYD